MSDPVKDMLKSVGDIEIKIDESVPEGVIRINDAGMQFDVDAKIPETMPEFESMLVDGDIVTTVKQTPTGRIIHCRGVIGCPACDCRTFQHIRGKLHCNKCHRILETCCD
jgi:hypothetical protein